MQEEFGLVPSASGLKSNLMRTGRYEAAGIGYNCHCPPKAFEAGTWCWRFHYTDARGRPSAWSKTRRPGGFRE